MTAFHLRPICDPASKGLLFSAVFQAVVEKRRKYFEQQHFRYLLHETYLSMAFENSILFGNF